MPTRQPNLGRAPRAALLAPLVAPWSPALLPLLAGCGPARNQFAPACPRPSFLGDAADLDIYPARHRAGRAA